MARRSRRTLAVAFAASLALFASAEAKELHWRALEVEARLDADGTLSVSELQRMVFTGDWNGGERKFRLGLGQMVVLDRLVRLDPDGGGSTELTEGSLDEVDRYDWSSSDTLRWRSRKPSDPEFRDTELAYRLDYRITGALRRIGERGYRLDHQFVFTERDGVIERTVVRLALAPEWRASRSLPESWELGALAPGEGFVLTTDLTYEGAGLPANAAPPEQARAVRFAAVLLFLAGAQYFLWRTRRRDRALGRFAAESPSQNAPIDAEWLEKRVFSLPPEVVGALWDRAVGSAEVAATLARLTQEGKLKSSVTSSGWLFKSENLHLELLCDRAALSDYERALIDGLFGIDTFTDTESIRKRYRGTGFDPAAKIRGGVESRLRMVRGFADGSPKPRWRPTGALFLAAVSILLLTAIGTATGLIARPSSSAIAICFFLPFSLVVASIPGWIGAFTGQGSVGSLTGPYVGLLLSELLMAALLWFFSGMATVHLLHLVGGLLFALGLVRSQANVLATRESAEGLVRRRELARARDYFEAELAKADPRLEDRWFPYLLAFGLAPRMERWFRRFGGVTRTTPAGTFPTSGGGSFGGGGGSSSWSGGGGAFGGGGASATWAMAATAMSAGVSAPSSSGGSGGGGGGGSSGGGGGGGW